MTTTANAGRSGPKPVDLWGVKDADTDEWLGQPKGSSSPPVMFASRETAMEYAGCAAEIWPDSAFVVAHISDPANHRQTRVTAAGVVEIRGEDDGFDPDAKFSLGGRDGSIVFEMSDGIVACGKWMSRDEAARLLEWLRRRERHRGIRGEGGGGG